jgi:hypothetical protein
LPTLIQFGRATEIICNFALNVAFVVVGMVEAFTSVLRKAAPPTSGKLNPARQVSGLFENAGNESVNDQSKSADAIFVNGGPAYYAYSQSRNHVDIALSVSAPRNSYMFYPDDLTYNYVANYTYHLPFDGVFASLLQRLTRGWIIPGMATGFPATRKASGSISLTGSGLHFRNVAGKITTQSSLEPAVNDTNQVFDSGTLAPEGRGQISDSGVRSFRGPSIINKATGHLKSSRITESTILIQAGSFNIFNHANFTNGVGNCSTSCFGQTTNAFPIRWVN